jgi:SAM-dependent methyltransferase
LTSALQLYDEGLRAVVAGRAVPVQLCDDRGRCTPLALHSWCADQVTGDGALLDRCAGPTLDVGCGPGRLTSALTARGLPALGIDISRAAVRLTRRRGASALRASVFDRLPAEGRWDTVLLADGNIGIGGDPHGLLRRISALLAPAGRIVVELDPLPVTDVRRVRLRLQGRQSEYFPWARVAAADIAAIAAETALTCATTTSEEGRWCSVLTRR